MIVTSPNVRYNGTIGGDVFVEGVCRNPSQANLWYYKAQGFGIGESEIEVPQAEERRTRAHRPGSTRAAREEIRVAGICCNAWA